MILRWECTCGCCPEQYDIYFKNKAVAYFRLRHGRLFVHPYKHQDIQWSDSWYECEFEDKYKGCFNSNLEREYFIRAINLVIIWKLIWSWIKKK